MKNVIILILSFFILLSTFIFCKNNPSVGGVIIEDNEPECFINSKIVTVNGYSMYPFLNSEEDVQALFNYYDCNDILRDDVVLYEYSANDNLLIKFIKAIPGDRWDLKKTDIGYEIVVNDVSLLNSEGNLYLIPESSIKRLKLYVKDYPIIPADTYLLLGNKIDGSTDSTTFGLVSKKYIMAKIEKK